MRIMKKPSLYSFGQRRSSSCRRFSSTATIFLFLCGLVLLLPVCGRAQGTAPSIAPAGTGCPPSVVVCVDPTEKQTFTATGGTAPDPTIPAPCPPWTKDGDPIYIWTYDTLTGTPASGADGSANLQMNRDTTGQATIKVKVKQKWKDASNPAVTTTTTSPDSTAVVFIIPKVEVKLEIEKVGGKDTIIEPANKYSENTKIKASAVFAAGGPNAGQICTTFTGTVNIAEDGTKIYSQNSGAIPKSITFAASDMGVKSFIVKSLADAKKTFLTKPDPAKLKTTNYPVFGGQSLEVKQWVDLNNNNRVDWCEQASDDILSAAKTAGGEKGTVTGHTTGFGADFFEDKKWGKTFDNDKLVFINSAARGHRLNTSKQLTETVLHEARHNYQEHQTDISPPGSIDNDSDPIEDPDNDDDPGFFSDGDRLYEIGNFLSERFILESRRVWKGDSIKDDANKVDDAMEIDAENWAIQNK